VGHAESLEGVLPFEGLKPRDLIVSELSSVGIIRLNDLEPSSLECLLNLLPGGKGGEPVSDLDTLLDPDVFLVVLVITILGQHDPLVPSEESSLLEDSCDLGEGIGLVGGVAGGLDLVCSVEGVGLELLGKVLR
jgi:hypothetical protein